MSLRRFPLAVAVFAALAASSASAAHAPKVTSIASLDQLSVPDRPYDESADADAAMAKWLASRFRQSSALGFVAESEGAIVGFLTARVDDWESIPQVIEPRRIGIIDAVYVADEFRRQGIGSQLIERAIDAMRNENAVAVETIYDAWNDASSRAWHRAGFAPWMVHAYRML